MALAFGTSGLRGLVSEMSDLECYCYTQAFLKYLFDNGYERREIAIAGDLRQSTNRILNAVTTGIEDSGCFIDYCGKIPTPALAYYGIKNGKASIMVTGSHIPDDRNGIKFNLVDGEILKRDEAGISERYKEIRKNEGVRNKFNLEEMLVVRRDFDNMSVNSARRDYIKRYIDFFPENCLKDKKIVFYKHSSAARDIIPVILMGLGASVIRVGSSEKFIPVDTEALRDEDAEFAARCAAKYSPFAIMSADGDGDRPLLFDENGEFVRGDILGIIASVNLGADSVSLPISCNTSIEICSNIPDVRRTKIGSSYVVESVYNAAKEGRRCAVGYEANGGFILGSNIEHDGGFISKLPTRDAVLPLISAVLLLDRKGQTISELVSDFSPRFTSSGIIRDFSRERGERIISLLSGENGIENAEKYFDFRAGCIEKMDYTDGARMFFGTGEILHVRQSGNAPEFRCYAEADKKQMADELRDYALGVVKRGK